MATSDVPGGSSGVLPQDGPLRRSISGRMLFLYILGDVLGSGIYVLIGLVAGEVGGAFWAAFGVGVVVALLTGFAYAELSTKYPRAAGAALYVHLAFKNRFFTFVVTFCMLAATMAATGALALAFGGDYFQEFATLPTTLVALVFVALLAVINFRGITESSMTNAVMTFVEVTGLVIILAIGAAAIFSGEANYSEPLQITEGANPLLAILGGAALAFFAMTGFENASNITEETKNPIKDMPKALLGGISVAGLLYLLVALSTAMVVPTSQIAGSESALLTVVEQGPFPIPLLLFAGIALIAVTNTALVTLVTQARIMYGMAREGGMPAVFGRVHVTRRTPWVAIIFTTVVVMGLLLTANVERLATVTVVFLIFIYGLVCAAALKLRGDRVDHQHYTAPTALLWLGILANAALLAYTVYSDPGSLKWCGGLLVLGLVLYAVNRVSQNKLDSKVGVGDDDAVLREAEQREHADTGPRA
jgi:basic amino acid/polyamine antiporter, APA family